MSETTALTVSNEETTVSVFGAAKSFDEWNKMALILSKSTMVPKNYRGENNLGNVLVAMDLASRMRVSPITLMQHMDDIHGKPAIASKFKLAQVNSSGKFTPLRYDWEYPDKDETEEVEYVASWSGAQGNRVPKMAKITIRNIKCRCRSIDTQSKEELVGPWVSIKMAVKEGWYTRSGSKWRTLYQKMLQYRAVSFWVDTFDPGAAMGMPTREDVEDSGFEIIDGGTTIVDLNKSAEQNMNTADVEEAVVVEEKETVKPAGDEGAAANTETINQPAKEEEEELI